MYIILFQVIVYLKLEIIGSKWNLLTGPLFFLVEYSMSY